MRLVRLILAGKSLLISRERKKMKKETEIQKLIYNIKSIIQDYYCPNHRILVKSSFPVLDKMPQHRLTTVTFSICRQLRTYRFAHISQKPCPTILGWMKACIWPCQTHHLS